MFKEKNVLVVVTGSVSAYKAASFVRLLVKDHAHVRVAMTQAAQEFITSKTLAILSGHDVLTDLFVGQTTAVVHIDWAKWADIIYVVPATANIIGKLANGLADDAPTATIMASAAQKIIAPAMNDVMLANPAVARNLATLATDGWLVIEPAEGFLAEGYAAKGRLPEPEAILAETAIRLRAQAGQLQGKKVVITAGGTREALDPVRFLTNKSSGKMGYALAQAAAENGAEVTLITTVDRQTIFGVTKVMVDSTQAMYEAVLAAWPTADIFIGAAAVSDFKPATLAQDKIKKQGTGGLTLNLIQNPDILQTVGQQKARHQLVVGFAAETQDVIEYGQAKLKKKHADMLIVNDVSSPNIGFSSDDNVITILTPDQPAETLPQADKLTLAREIMQRISALKS